MEKTTTTRDPNKRVRVTTTIDEVSRWRLKEKGIGIGSAGASWLNYLDKLTTENVRINNLDAEIKAFKMTVSALQNQIILVKTELEKLKKKGGS